MQQNAMHIARSSLWIMPFLCFGSGYLVTRIVLNQKTVTVPALIGKTADVALLLLSEQNLNPRIIGRIDEPDLEAGTILNQIPRANVQARPHQTIFLVISARPAQQAAGSWIGMTEEQITAACADKKSKPVFIHLPHSTPAHTCFAQFPTESTLIADTPFCYISTGMHNKYIFPSLLNACAADAFNALKKQGIQVTIIGEYATADNQELKKLKIIDQRPLPGSFVLYDSIHKPSVHVRLGR